jgi:hypothetical protein
MTDCQIIISSQAARDIAAFYDCICYKYKQPNTADKNRRGLQTRISQLSWLADVVGYNEYIQSMFGANARCITFKKMTIIFFVEDDCVYVERVIASSLIH